MSAVTSGPIVITDSTADLPADLVAKYGLTVVPLHVVVDGQVYDEGLDIAPDAVLSPRRPPSKRRTGRRWIQERGRRCPCTSPARCPAP